jgi:O-antigen/teichoic acid export membrane protein
MWLQIIKQAHRQLFSELKAHISKNILPTIVGISALLLFFGALFGGVWLISEIVRMFFGPDPIGIVVFLACSLLYLGSLMGYTIYIGNTIHELYAKFKKDKENVFRNLSE